MKKIVSLTLVTVLALALCLPVAARYIHCEWCTDGKITTDTSRKIIGTTQCPIDESMTDYVYWVVKKKVCSNKTTCGYEEITFEGEETYCHH